VKKYIFSLVVLLLILPWVNSFSQQGWIPQQTGYPYNFVSVHFLNEMYGMAASSGSNIIKTTNGGINWSELNPGENILFTDIRIVNPNIACAAGTTFSNGLPIIIRTSNAGVNWSIVYTETGNTYSFNNLKFFNDSGTVCLNTALFGGARAIKTYNSGLNWLPVPSVATAGTQQHFGFLSTEVYWHLTYTEVFNPFPPHWFYDHYSIRTTNGGVNWSITLCMSYMDINYCNRLYLFDNFTGYAVRSDGNWFKTTNNGLNWNVGVTTPQSCIASNVCVVNANKIYFTGMKNSVNYVIGKTTNGGMNWAIQMTPQNYLLNKIYFLNENTGWIGSNSGIILKTTDGGLLPVNIVSEEVPSAYNLSQNYPNPFNPCTKITFAVPSSEAEGSPWRGYGVSRGVGLVSLRIYDIAGREVAVLVNEQLSSGTYEVTFDGSRLNSGVFFYRLTAGNFTETKRMLLVK
jgi:photosystem II stability/assembly factor-like uncharacterized protein